MIGKKPSTSTEVYANYIYRDGFLIQPDMIRPVGEEIWAALSVVAEAVLQEPLGPDVYALQEEALWSGSKAESNANYHQI